MSKTRTRTSRRVISENQRPVGARIVLIRNGALVRTTGARQRSLAG